MVCVYNLLKALGKCNTIPQEFLKVNETPVLILSTDLAGMGGEMISNASLIIAVAVADELLSMGLLLRAKRKGIIEGSGRPTDTAGELWTAPGGNRGTEARDGEGW